MSAALYACPDCKTPLEGLFCARCSFRYAAIDGIPRFFSRDPKFRDTVAIAAAYDALYAQRTGVWENQGRTPEFIRWFAGLLAPHAAGRLLEIGCGEGFLLAAVRGGEKYAVDLSAEAIRRARARGEAHFSLALGERLPFPDGHFDLVTSVGVMEHFLDVGEALREVRRILRPGGHYVTLTHVELSLPEKVRAKWREYVHPEFRPAAAARWVLGKLGPALPRQPIQNRYSTEGARAWLARAGFRVREVLHRRSRPELPLIGPYVVVYVAQK